MFQLIVDLLLPRHCVGCHASDEWLCQDCQSFIQLPRSFKCPFCKEETVAGRPCFTHSGAAISAVIPAGYYHDPILRRAIHALKYGHNEEIARILGPLLAKNALTYRTLLPSNAIVVPLPLATKRQRERGFNQADLLASFVARALNFPLAPRVLGRASREAQTHLEISNRSTNLADAFMVLDPEIINERNIILIDDVSTSGSTLEVAARVLKNSSAREIVGLVLAHG